MPVLTLAEAEERARLLDISTYQVSLDLTRGDEVFGSRTVARFGCTQPGAGTFVEMKVSALHRVVLNGVELDPSLLNDNRYALTDLRADNELVVQADVAYSSTGEGAHRFVDPADGETYVGTYCGLDLAQRVFACFDQPDLKARLEVTATAPPDWTVVANGLGARAESDPHRWEFAATPPLSPYLFVLVAGPLHTVRTEHRGVPFALHCRASLGGHLDTEAVELFALTTACFDRYLELFDEPYAFDSYDQAFVPGLNWGALETPGCITFRDEFLFRSAVSSTERQYRGTVIAHEMAHMWFGDLVTMRWWDDLWLSESFAEYMGFQVLTEATGFTGAWTDFAMRSKTRGYDADQRPSTHPVAPRREDVGDTETALSNADGITYSKGASALRQLVGWLGDSVFHAGVNDFLTRHRFGSATLADLLDALTRASGKDVHGWARQWLQTTGVDTISVSRLPDGQVAVDRQGSRPHKLSIGAYDRRADDSQRLTLREQIDVDIVVDHTVVDLPNGEPHALLLVNDGDLSYCKIRLDPQSLATVTDALSTVADPLSRAVLWTAARDLVRDGELGPATYLDLAVRQLPAETDSAVVQGVLQFARDEVVDRYLDPGPRMDALTALYDVCRGILSTAEAGASADVRLVAGRTLIDSVTAGHSAEEISSWLQAGEIPGGPGLDRELRWRVLLRLCVLGYAGQPQVDAELRRDPSTIGRESATRCRAALPDAETKEEAWASMRGDSDGASRPAWGEESGAELSNRLFVAAASGFWQPEQHDLLADYVPRFFPMAVALARRRGPVIAEALGSDAYPYYAVDRATLAAGERCLGEDAPPVALRRKLVDRLDDLRRALRVRSGADHLSR